MRTTIISYSFTGNNDALASSLAAALGAEHIRIVEPKTRTMGKIVFDMLFNRTPRVDPFPNVIDTDLVIFIAPVWMGQVATPLRACFNQLKSTMGKYAFISISGGAEGGNPKLGTDLAKRLGKPPVALIDMHISDLLPANPKPSREATSAYKPSADDIRKLTNTAVDGLRTVMSGVIAAS